MFRPLKFILRFLYFACFLFLVLSCKDDEPDKPDNLIVFNGRKFEVRYASFSYGEELADLRYNDPEIGPTHYYYHMKFRDGEVDPETHSLLSPGTYTLSFYIYTTMADHSPEFTGGSFSPVSPQDVYNDKAPLDESFYTSLSLRVDDNGDGAIHVDETWFRGLEGQIQIKRNGDSFTLKIDSTDPADNSRLTFNFQGTVDIR